MKILTGTVIACCFCKKCKFRLFQIGSVHTHQALNHLHQQQQSPQSQVPGAGGAAAAAGGASGGSGGTVGVMARSGGIYCYHCPPGIPTPRLPPSLDYPFAPTHPCKFAFYTLSVSHFFLSLTPHTHTHIYTKTLNVEFILTLHFSIDTLSQIKAYRVYIYTCCGKNIASKFSVIKISQW